MADNPADDGAPADPFTAMAEGAVQMHTLFMAFVDAGFTPNQAIYLLGSILARQGGGDGA